MPRVSPVPADPSSDARDQVLDFRGRASSDAARQGDSNRVPNDRDTATSLKDDGTYPAHAGTAQRSCTAFERECVQFFTDIVQVLGVPRSVGQIYGLLFASPYPLGFTDIVAKLQISKGSASQGLHLLRTLGAVQCAVKNFEGDTSHRRRELYEPELRLRSLFLGVLKERIEPLVTQSSASVRRLSIAIEDINLEKDKEFYRGRLRILREWRGQLGLLLPILKSLLGSRSI